MHLGLRILLLWLESTRKLHLTLMIDHPFWPADRELLSFQDSSLINFAISSQTVTVELGEADVRSACSMSIAAVRAILP